MQQLLLILIGLGATAPRMLFAQEAHLVRDINTIPSNSASSEPTELAAVGDRVFFVCFTPQYGSEVWVSDGTDSGTHLTRDIRPGYSTSAPRLLTAVGNMVFFIANDGIDGPKIWMSDGTESGTVMLPGTHLYRKPEELAEHEGNLYFTAQTDLSGAWSRDALLWRTDGTIEGTTFIDTKVNCQCGPERVSKLTGTSDKLFFVTGLSGSGSVFVTDGTTEGTSELFESDWDGIKQATAVGSGVFFVVGGTFGEVDQLYTSDGTVGGTFRVPTDSSSFQPSTGVGSTLMFLGYDPDHGQELWSSDGTAAGTGLVKDIYDGIHHAWSYNYFTNVDGLLYLSATDEINGRELWRSDGTENGTYMVKDINPGLGHSHPSHLANVEGTLFFEGYHASTGWELWKSDGTAESTHLVKEIQPGSRSGIESIVGVAGRAFFGTDDGKHGKELWASDGTEAGTNMVKDIWSKTLSSFPEKMTSVDGMMFFQAWSGEVDSYGWRVYELWKTDGSFAGTEMITSLGTQYHPLQDMDGVHYFSTLDANGCELWRSDGTAEGTRMVEDIAVGALCSITGPDSAVLGSTLYFPADDGVVGRELWHSDGTDFGTDLVVDIYPGGSSLSSKPSGLVVVGDRLFFSATGGPSLNRELWASDGTASGTAMVKEIREGNDGANPASLTSFRNVLVFRADDGIHGNELWRSDGTDSGTQMLKDIYPGDGDSWPGKLTSTDSLLFFSAGDPDRGTSLWRTDGSTAGTFRVGPKPDDLVAVGDRLYFTVWKTLYVSDGTEEGTIPVRDFYDHPEVSDSYSISELINAGGMLAFVLTGSPTSNLWTSDGTSEGTVRLTTLERYSRSSTIRDLTVGCGQLYFTLEDELFGREPWVYSFEDDDCDNVMQSIDNCPSVSNPDQLDCDGDGVGNSCSSIYMGDFDGNRVINLDDFRGLADCLSGPGHGPTPAIDGCEKPCLDAFDLDRDGSIDLREVAIFQGFLFDP